MNKNKNSNKFISIYNRIDEHMRKELKIDSHTTYTDLVNIMIEKGNNIFKANEGKLKSYGNLRNAIVHNYKDPNSHAIAEPHDEVVSDFEKLYNIISNPPLALTNMSIEFDQVYKVGLDDDLNDTIKTMKDRIFTQVPVIDEKSNLIGVFSENTLISYLADEEIFSIEDLKISNFEKYIPIENHAGELYKFISRDKNIFDVREVFQNDIEGDKRLSVIFITHNGKSNEKILGLITAWDVIAYPWD